MAVSIGIDIGGTKTLVGLVDGGGRVIEEVRFPTLSAAPERMTGRLVREIYDLWKRAPSRPRGIGVGVPGPVDAARGVVLSPPNLPGWHDFPLRKKLSEITGLPVIVENDPDAALLGQQRFGRRQPFPDSAVYVTVSTGIGAGLWIDGQLYRGAHFRAGEVGHMIMARDGERCFCGKNGCICAYASGRGIAVRAEKKLGNPPEGTDRWSAEEVFRAARCGRQTAVELVQDAATYLALGLIALIEMLDPDLIVLGGAIAIMQPSFVAFVKQKVSNILYGNQTEPPPIIVTDLGLKAGMIGAASLVF